MRKLIVYFVLIGLCYSANAEVKKYSAIVTVLFHDYKGFVFLDLEGENTGMIRIDEMRKGKLISSSKVNAGLVSKIIIGKDTFYRQDLQDTYDHDGVRKMNCFLKKLSGKNDICLFEWKDAANLSHYYFKFSVDNVAKNIHHPYYDEWTISFYEAFKGCEKIYKSFEYSKKEKYPLYNMTTDNEKVAAWKKIIKEYDNCLEAKK